VGIHGCAGPGDAHTNTSTYKIRILGESKAALEQHIVTGDVTFDGGPFVRGGTWYIYYLATDSLDQLIEGQGSVALSTEEHPDLSVQMQPYLCGEGNDYWDRRSHGESALETHEVLLTDNGEWKLNTDFTRHLYYSCEMTGKQTFTIGTYFAGPNRCDEPEAEGTEVEIQAVGMPELVPDTCLTHINDIGSGNFSTMLSFKDSTNGSLSLSFSDCFPSTGPPEYPVAYTWGENFPDPTCGREGAGGELFGELYGDLVGNAGVFMFEPSELVWTIQNAELVDGGTQTSDIEARYVLSEDPERSYTLSAHLTGPLYRIPIEGDGI